MSNQTYQTIKIYTDGACRPNPGKSGSGVALYLDDKKPLLYTGAFNPNGTNNTAELLALGAGLFLAKKYLGQAKNIIVLSDSKYSLDCLNWAKGWAKKGWNGSNGSPVKNKPLVEKNFLLFEEIKNKITLQHVRGHQGIEGNELADRMAVQAIFKKTEKIVPYPYNSIEEVLVLESF